MRQNKVIVLGIDGADPCFIRRMLRRGELPNIRALMRDGFFAEATPSFTAKTPQNWTTIATGAEPGSHGIA